MCIIQGIQQVGQQDISRTKLRFNIQIDDQFEELEFEWGQISSMDNIQGILKNLSSWAMLENQSIFIEILARDGNWQSIDQNDEGFRVWLGQQNSIRVQIQHAFLFDEHLEMNDDLFYLDNMKQEQFDFLAQNYNEQIQNHYYQNQEINSDSRMKLETENFQYQYENQQTQQEVQEQQIDRLFFTNFDQAIDFEIIPKEEEKVEPEHNLEAVFSSSESQIFLDYNDSDTRKNSSDLKDTPKVARKRIEKYGRNGEKTVQEAMQLVNNYLKISRENRKITKDKAAKQLGQKKKTLDDYKLQLKIAKFLGFNFQAHKSEGMGKVRMFNEQQIKSKNINRKQMIFNLQSVEEEEF